MSLSLVLRLTSGDLDLALRFPLCVFPILDETENLFPKMSKERFAGRWGPECPCALYSPKDGSCVTHTAQNTSVEKALRMGPQGAPGTAATWLRVLSGLGRVFCFLRLVSLGEKVGWLVLGKGSACQQRARRERATWAIEGSRKSLLTRMPCLFHSEGFCFLFVCCSV